MIKSLVRNAEEALDFLSRKFKMTTDSYSDLDTADDDYTLVSKSGALITVFEVHGYSRLLSWGEYQDISHQLGTSMSHIFNRKGHSLQVSFVCDIDKTDSEVAKKMAPMRQMSRSLSLDIDDLFHSKEAALTNTCDPERCFLVLRSDLDALADKNASLKKHAKAISATPMSYQPGNQRILGVVEELRTLHTSVKENLLQSLTELGYYVSECGVKDSLHHARKFLFDRMTSEAWKPILPSDPLPTSLKRFGKSGASAFLWPSLSDQLFPEGMENLGAKMCKISDRIYAHVLVDLFPSEITSFTRIMNRLKDLGIPWSMSANIVSGGMNLMRSKRLLSQLLAFSSSHNKLILNSDRQLSALNSRADVPVVKYSMVFTTWANSDNPEVCQSNALSLMKAVESWGGAHVSLVSGDPSAVTCSTVPGLSTPAALPQSACPFPDALKMLPLARPASPWMDGNMLFRTPDGKLWPYQPGSNYQASWIDLIYAKSGSGKSVLSNAMNMAMIMSAGETSLPYVGVIDIGPSSRGLTSLLRYSLPKATSTQVVDYVMLFDKSHAINPFDTLLGARIPTHAHKAFLNTFMSLVLTDPDKQALEEDISVLISQVIDLCFAMHSDDSMPKQYIVGTSDEIDQALEAYGEGQMLEFSSWWQVVDYLFEKGEYALAKQAQTFAVPTISDLVQAVHHHEIFDLYKEVHASTGESYPQYFSRKISGVLQKYPNLSLPTKVSFSDFRVISIDLANVVSLGSSEGRKQTALAYLLARHLIASHFFRMAEDVEVPPKAYRQYHKENYEKTKNIPKRIVYDEFHQTSGSPMVRQQVIRDMREGRKANIQVSLVSQSLNDFDPVMVEFATSIFILNGGTKEVLDQMCTTFGLNKTERLALQRHVHGPSKNGNNFLAQFSTTLGICTQLLNLTLGSIELWALTTKTMDAYIRDKLYELTQNPKAVRKLLAEKFPNGSCVSLIESLRRQDPAISQQEVADDIIKKLFDELNRW